jgi:tetratricopeptide (TPR) repeat protein
LATEKVFLAASFLSPPFPLNSSSFPTLITDFETAKQLFVEGLQFLESNDLHSAEGRFARSLQILPERVSTLNNLAAIKLKLNKFTEAEELARKAVALEDSPEAWANLALALTATDHHDEALQACDRALAHNNAHLMAWLARAMILRQLTRYDEALVACDRALKLDPNRHEALYQKTLVLKELGRLPEAQEIFQNAVDIRVAASPVFIGQRRATQKAEALIVNRNPRVDDSFQSFEDLSRFCPNFPAQLADHLIEEFHFNYVFFGAATSPSARNRIPQPDVVINNCVNGEALLSDGSLAAVKELVESFGVPVVNHPAKVVPTVRDMAARLIADVPGVRAPKTARFFAVGKAPEDVLREIESQFDYPLITRTLLFQEGKGMSKVDSREALLGVLSAPDRPAQFFVTQFIDSRGKREFHRKIRAAIVKDEIILARVDFDTFWNVHGRKSPKRLPFYLEHPWLLDEEKRICSDPEGELGASAMKSLRAVRERIPLDVLGIDFDVDPDGRVIFYEGNATMNLFSTANKAAPNPKEADERLKLAFERYFTSLLPQKR